ncbi:hypothetical protein KJS94_16570 [Flavihumibacter rivuli]|uniref:hypothetical protein n=1 Tax=Flavihumibacter rivuli TaxID=2838156 RepID=UPI001BDE382E|nr:hypothetical protein [Flavihumibacter rivuli]ULQ56265.1 hypothetical protein KJS94_16570 [Flavihumibacter rivuli]
MIRKVFSICIALVAGLSLVSDSYEVLVLSLLAVVLLQLLDKLGKGIVLREATALIYVLTCLVMPLVGYEYYPVTNKLSLIWLKYMVVDRQTYFSYALPAISLFSFGLTLPIKGGVDEGAHLDHILGRIRNILQTRKEVGLQILMVGLLLSFFTRFLPLGIQFFIQLFFFSSFAGILYIYYTPAFKNKLIVLIVFAIFLLNNALNTGMFTVVAYMGITIFSFFYFGAKVSLLRKVLVVFLALIGLLVLQNTKRTYRQYTWLLGYQGNKVTLFADLFIENLQKGNALIENEVFFPTYIRLNQGYNVALVMKRIPNSKDFDNGDRLRTVFLSAFVPRFLWPDKPEAGGKFNMDYYAGFKLRGFSTNVGPLGEAYGSFGVKGGILYMFLLGLFLRWAYGLIFTRTKRIPLLLCWIPVIFYNVTYSAETDTLSIINSLVKTIFFMWLVAKALPSWFGQNVPSKRIRTVGQSPHFTNP